MTWIAENPWPLAGSCFVLAFGFLIAVRLTQQGKYLMRSGIAAALGATILLIEFVWDTDVERIERVIREVARAVQAGDAETISSYLVPAPYQIDGNIPNARAAMMSVGNVFEFKTIKIRSPQITAGRLTGRGKADFYAFAAWEETTRMGESDFNATPPPGIQFSVGFERTDQNEWKIYRIEIVDAPSSIDPAIAIQTAVQAMASGVRSER